MYGACMHVGERVMLRYLDARSRVGVCVFFVVCALSRFMLLAVISWFSWVLAEDLVAALLGLYAYVRYVSSRSGAAG